MAHLLIVIAAALAPCTSGNVPIIAAHRGGLESGLPENTLPAFRHAADAGVRVIEVDLRATADGHVVVMHDASVERTTDGNGLVRDLSLSELRALDAGGGARVPTFDEVLDAAAEHGVELLVDLKPAPGLDPGDLARAVVSRGEAARVLFGIRSLDDHARLAAVAPRLRYLGFVPRPDAIDSFLAAGVAAIRLWPAWIDRQPELIRRVQDGGAQVWVTTDRAPVSQLERLTGLGVDALLTDIPGAALTALGCPGAQHPGPSPR